MVRRQENKNYLAHTMPIVKHGSDNILATGKDR